MTLVIAHRGDSANAPENTLAAFRKAVALGVDMIELDVHLTSDGCPVLMHDFDVDRCTNGHGPIARHPLAELQALDAGGWFSPEFSGERIPLLGEALETIPAPVQINMHLKPYDPDDDALERIVLEHVRRFDLAGRLVVVHDAIGSLERLRARRPDLVCCLLPPPGVSGVEYVDLARAHGLSVLQPDRGHMSPEFVAYAHRHGMRANVFYADTIEDMRLYITWGIDGILTNYPERMLRSGVME